jgi:hypothetical protein
MRDHIRILAWLNIAFGALGLLAVVAICGVAGVAALITGHLPDVRPFAIPILGLIAAAICLLVLLLSLPGLIAGVGLLNLRPWARILAIVLSALNLLHVPFGTALGIYGLWVLLQEETERIFAAQGRS